jgi:CMP-N,N'-diacetyllegionaminic acid synthase
MDVLGLVPARGGSRGIPGKNLVPLAGRPLLAWTCEQALASECLTRVAVSTDSEEIARTAHELGVAVIERPAALAADDTPMLPVVAHALDETQADAVVLLQPTSPLRRAADIDAAFDLWRSTGADSVVSVVRVPHRYVPSSQLRRAPDGRLAPYDGDASTSSRQEKPTLYARNGPAVLVVSADVVRGGSLYGAHSRGYEMSELDSIDIDEPADLELAELVLSTRA